MEAWKLHLSATYLQIAELDHLSCKCRVEQLGGGAVLEQPVIEGRVGSKLGVVMHLQLPDEDDLSLLKAVHCSKSKFEQESSNFPEVINKRTVRGHCASSAAGPVRF